MFNFVQYENTIVQISNLKFMIDDWKWDYK